MSEDELQQVAWNAVTAMTETAGCSPLEVAAIAGMMIVRIGAETNDHEMLAHFGGLLKDMAHDIRNAPEIAARLMKEGCSHV